VSSHPPNSGPVSSFTEFKAFLKAQMISRATFGCVFASAGFRLAANNGSEKLLEADAAIKKDIKSLYSLMNQV
jgi:hypothetical protein